MCSGDRYGLRELNRQLLPHLYLHLQESKYRLATCFRLFSPHIVCGILNGHMFGLRQQADKFTVNQLVDGQCIGGSQQQNGHRQLRNLLFIEHRKAIM